MAGWNGVFWTGVGVAAAVPTGLGLVAGRHRAAVLGDWFVSPMLACVALAGWEMLTHPGGGGQAGLALYGLALVTPVIAPVWVAAFLMDLNAGAATRALGRLVGLGRVAEAGAAHGRGGVA